MYGKEHTKPTSLNEASSPGSGLKTAGRLAAQLDTAGSLSPFFRRGLFFYFSLPQFHCFCLVQTSGWLQAAGCRQSCPPPEYLKEVSNRRSAVGTGRAWLNTAVNCVVHFDRPQFAFFHSSTRTVVVPASATTTAANMCIGSAGVQSYKTVS